MDAITLVLTSCGRLDLLERTIDSLFRSNTYNFDRCFLIDGCCDATLYREIRRRYKDHFDLVFNEQNLGQAGTIDHAYSMVDTEYIFHCEDDWDFHGAGFVEKSLEILKENPRFLQVWIRDHDDSGHPRLAETFYTRDGIPYRRMAPNYRGWKGFTWSPGLRRLSDYQIVRPYSSHYFPGSANPWEKAVGILYSNLGFVTVSTAEGYCRHSGAHRHIPIPVSL